MTSENAQITGTFFGTDENGDLACYLRLEGAGWIATYGNPGVEDQVPALLRALGLTCWEQLKGQTVRVNRSGLVSAVDQVGHAIQDRWFEWEQNLDGAQNG